MEFELPHLEDIYDFGEAELKDYLIKIDQALTQSYLSAKLESKARRIKELIEVEIDERISINQITLFCAKEINSDLFQEIQSESTVSTRSQSSSQQDVDTAEQMWNLHKNRKKGKNAQQTVRDTLKKTQISSAMVIGGSSVKAPKPKPVIREQKPQIVKKSSMRQQSPSRPIARSNSKQQMKIPRGKIPVQQNNNIKEAVRQSMIKQEKLNEIKKEISKSEVQEEIIDESSDSEDVEIIVEQSTQMIFFDTIWRVLIHPIVQVNEQFQIVINAKEESQLIPEIMKEPIEELQEEIEKQSIQIQEVLEKQPIEIQEISEKQEIQEISEKQEIQEKINEIQEIVERQDIQQIQDQEIHEYNKEQQLGKNEDELNENEELSLYQEYDTDNFIQQYDEKLKIHQSKKQEVDQFDVPSINEIISKKQNNNLVENLIGDQILDTNQQQKQQNTPSQINKRREKQQRKLPPKPQKPIQPVQQDITDYSKHFKDFSEIFSGANKIKTFNYQNALKETIQIFKEFNQILSNPDFELQRKFKLSLAPLELNPYDLLNSRYQDMSNIPNDKEMYYRVVRARAEVYDIVSRTFSKKRDWTELPHGMNLRSSWNIMWTWSKPRLDLSKLLVFQKVNHFANTKNFSRKDLLKRNLEKMTRISNKCAQIWKILPSTYVLPKEYLGFLDEYSELTDKNPKENYWIMKPVGKSRGRGISLVSDLNQVVYSEQMIIQRYLTNPLLLSGFKFDLRIYVLITKFSPLEAFLYKEGFARVSTVPFSMNPNSIQNKFIHLTNSSIQKYNQNAQTNQADLMFGGTKISLQQLKDRLTLQDISYDSIWNQVQEIVVKSLIAVQSEIPGLGCCFDLVGFDIMIDDNHKAWLIEINSSPSLARDNFLDDIIKQQLIDDTMDLVEPPYFNKDELIKVLEKRFAQLQRGNINHSVSAMNEDISRILEGRKLREYGELPDKIGNYEMIAPSPTYEKLIKLAYPRGISSKLY